MTTALEGRIQVDDKGVARISGTRMKVTDLVLDKMANHSTPEEMANQFPPLTLGQIHAALTYYYEHQTELDAQIERDRSVAEQMHSRAPAPPSRKELSDRLVARGGEGSAA